MVVYICAARYHNLLPNSNLNYPTVEIPNPPIFYHAAVQYTKLLNHIYLSLICVPDSIHETTRNADFILQSHKQQEFVKNSR